MKRTVLLLASLMLLSGCEVYENGDFNGYYAVESYLIADRQLPPVTLSRTSSIDEEYSLSENYVQDGEMEIRLLNEDSTVAETYRYTGDGRYFPVDDSAIVRGGRLYQLHISMQDGEVVESTTRVPGDFTTVNELKDSYVFEGGEQIKVTNSPSEYPGRQTYYVFSVNAVMPNGDQFPTEDRLTPFFRDLVVEEGQHIGIYTVNSYGIFNEGSYRQHEDGTVTLAVPWLAVAFYGPNDVVVNAIDDNMYDFMRTQSAQASGGESLLTNELRNIEYNIDGGIGIFGSMASDTNRVEILRK